MEQNSRSIVRMINKFANKREMMISKFAYRVIKAIQTKNPQALTTNLEILITHAIDQVEGESSGPLDREILKDRVLSLIYSLVESNNIDVGVNAPPNQFESTLHQQASMVFDNIMSKKENAAQPIQNAPGTPKSIPVKIIYYDNSGLAQQRRTGEKNIMIPEPIFNEINALVEQQISATIEKPDVMFNTTKSPQSIDTKYDSWANNSDYIAYYSQRMRERKNQIKQTDAESYNKLMRNEAFLVNQEAGSRVEEYEENVPYSPDNLASSFEENYLDTVHGNRQFLELIGKKKDVEDGIAEVGPDKLSETEQIILSEYKMALPRVFKAEDVSGRTKREGGRLGLFQYFISGPGQSAASDPAVSQDIQRLREFASSKGANYNKGSPVSSNRAILEKSLPDVGGFLIDLMEKKSPLVMIYAANRVKAEMANEYWENAGSMVSTHIETDEGDSLERPDLDSGAGNAQREGAEKQMRLTDEENRNLIKFREESKARSTDLLKQFSDIARNIVSYITDNIKAKNPDFASKEGFSGGFSETEYDQSLKNSGLYDNIVRMKEINKALQNDPKNEDLLRELDGINNWFKGKGPDGQSPEKKFKAIRDKFFINSAKSALFFDAVGNYILKTMVEKLNPENIDKMLQTSADDLRNIREAGFEIQTARGKVISVKPIGDHIDFSKLMGIKEQSELLSQYFRNRHQVLPDPNRAEDVENELFPDSSSFVRRLVEDTEISTKDVNMSLYTSQQYMLSYLGRSLVDENGNQKFNPFAVKSFISAFKVDAGAWRLATLSSRYTTDSEKEEAANHILNAEMENMRSADSASFRDISVPAYQQFFGPEVANRVLLAPSNEERTKIVNDLLSNLKANDKREYYKFLFRLQSSKSKSRGGVNVFGLRDYQDFLNANPHSSVKDIPPPTDIQLEDLRKRKLSSNFSKAVDDLIKISSLRARMSKFGSTEIADRLMSQIVEDIIICQMAR